MDSLECLPNVKTQTAYQREGKHEAAGHECNHIAVIVERLVQSDLEIQETRD